MRNVSFSVSCILNEGLEAMKRKRYREEQIAFALRQHKVGTSVPDIVRFSTYPKNLPGDEFTAQQNHPAGAWAWSGGQSAEKRSFFGASHDLPMARVRITQFGNACRSFLTPSSVTSVL